MAMQNSWDPRWIFAVAAAAADEASYGLNGRPRDYPWQQAAASSGDDRLQQQQQPVTNAEILQQGQ